MRSLTFRVYGKPAPQGSKRGFVVDGRAVVVDTNKATLRTWRDDITAAAAQVMGFTWTPIPGPVQLEVTFYMPRPKAHFGTRKGEPYLKDTAPVWCDKKPDLDKLVRGLCDALTAAGAYGDDNQVVSMRTVQRYVAEGDRPGALVSVLAIGGADA